MGRFTVRLEERHERIIQRLIKLGVAKTKSEVLRLAVEELGRKRGVI